MQRFLTLYSSSAIWLAELKGSGRLCSGCDFLVCTQKFPADLDGCFCETWDVFHEVLR